jgi:hypothetical protein
LRRREEVTRKQLEAERGIQAQDDAADEEVTDEVPVEEVPEEVLT